ncbi:MAG: hypothetical protein ABG776_11205 [Cyanobacteria bacterium J06555_13]
MPFIFKLRTLATTTACATVAVAGLVSPALAQDRTDWLTPGGTTNTSGVFSEGENIYGTCDSDCTDLDMYLYDGYGNLVAEDTELDAYPIVTAPYTGEFYIEVTMPSCYAEACYVEVSSDYGF